MVAESDGQTFRVRPLWGELRCGTMVFGADPDGSGTGIAAFVPSTMLGGARNSTGLIAWRSHGVSKADGELTRGRYVEPEGRHYSCRASGGGSVVLVDEASEPVAPVDLVIPG